MVIRNLFTVVGLVILTLSCKSKNAGGNFKVTGNFKNAAHPAFVGDPGSAAGNHAVDKVYLYEVPFGAENSLAALDSVTLTGDNGSFTLHGTAKDEGVYELVFSNGFIVLISNDVPAIEVEVDLAKKDNYYSVKGSDATQQIKDFAMNYTDYSMRVNRAFSQMDSLKRFQASDSLIIAATSVKNNEIKTLNDYLTQFIHNSKHPSVSIFALGFGSRSFTKEGFETILTSIVQKFPGNANVIMMKKAFDEQQVQMQEAAKHEEEHQSHESGWVGKQAPDLSLPDVNGKPVSISSFKGKYLLVDFWASWCGPCRAENPNVVRAFNQYKDKNFTILGVSLDREKSEWLQAIEKDQLNWTQVSDLKFWDSKAVEIYKFDAIPFNILIDPQGKVIAESLRGDQLEAKLKEVLQ